MGSHIITDCACAPSSPEFVLYKLVGFIYVFKATSREHLPRRFREREAGYGQPRKSNSVFFIKRHDANSLMATSQTKPLLDGWLLGLTNKARR